MYNTADVSKYVIE